MRRVKTDGNQEEIVAALRKTGAIVQSLHTVGRGVPDLLVAYRGVWYLLEVKDKEGSITKEQRAWYKKFGEQANIYIVHTPQEALEAIQCNGI
jgi:hypothetical protein